MKVTIIMAEVHSDMEHRNKYTNYGYPHCKKKKKKKKKKYTFVVLTFFHSIFVFWLLSRLIVIICDTRVSLAPSSVNNTCVFLSAVGASVEDSNTDEAELCGESIGEYLCFFLSSWRFNRTRKDRTYWRTTTKARCI